MKNVYKSFGSKAILRGANITIRRGEAVGIIGGSGTGKSTTLRIMAGLLMPDSVWLNYSLIPVCHWFAFEYEKILHQQAGSKVGSVVSDLTLVECLSGHLQAL